MPTVKKLEFANGTNITPPADLTLETAVNALPTFADDAAYDVEYAVGEGSIYLNSTLKAPRMYLGGAWRTGIMQNNATDATKQVLLDTDGSTTGKTNTLDFNSTDNRVYTFPDATGTIVLTLGAQELEAKTIKNGFLDGTKIRNGALDVEAAGALTIGATVGANNLTLGHADSTVQIPGNLTVSGTTTTINTDTLDVEDKNITVNKGGNDATSAGAGLTVDRTGTKGSLVYDNAAATKWKAGAQGSEVELADISTIQSFSSKTLVEPKIDNFMDINEETAPGSPAAGTLRVYAKNDGKIYKKNSLGIEDEIGAGGAGGGTGRNYLQDWYDGSKDIIVSSTTLGNTSNRLVDGVDNLKWARSTTAGLTVQNNSISPLRGDSDIQVTSSLSTFGSFVETPLFSLDSYDISKTIYINFDYYANLLLEYDFVIIRYNSSGVYQQVIALPPNTSTGTPASAELEIGFNNFKASFVASANAGDLYALRIRKQAAFNASFQIDSLFIGPYSEIKDIEKIKREITKNIHGFSVGDAVYLNGSIYTKAIASAANTAEVVGVVSKVLNPNQFELTLSGEVSGLTGLVAGEVYFLSADTAGALTTTEPTVVGQVSLPVGVASSTTSLYVAPKRGSVVGSSNARTQIALANNATTTVQDISAYDAGELTGWVSITATTPLRFYVAAQFSKNGAANNYNISYQVSGDTPPTGFSVTATAAGLLQVTLPSVTGFASASINYALNAPAVGTTFPLSVDAASVASGTLSPSRLPLPSSYSDSEATVMGLKQYIGDGTTYNGGVAPTLSGAGVSTRRAVFIPYQMQDGSWRMKFNFALVCTSTTSLSVSLNGIVSKNISNWFQAVTNFPGGNYGRGSIAPNVNTFFLTSDLSTNTFSASGDIELNSKPTWAY